MSEDELFRSGFVALVGPANAGKSTLLNTLLGQKVSIVSPKPQTTRNRILGVKTSSQSQLIFVDTPGFFRERSPNVRFTQSVRGALGQYLGRAVRDAVSEVDCVLLVLSAPELLVKREQLAPLSEVFRHENVPLPNLIALNKVDLVEKERLLPLFDALFREFSDAKGQSVEIVPISARSGDGVDILERRISDQVPFGPKLFPDDYVTDQTERFLAQEVIREKLFMKLGQEVPYSIAVQIERWQESDKLLNIGAVILVERTSQRGIVIGKGGERLKEVGRLARLELEDILEKRIFLELFVRVEENWTHTEKGLIRAGLL